MSPTMRPRGTRAVSKRRVDYRPPPFLVDDVELVFDLDPARTEVATTFTFRRNPAGARADSRAPLVLDGEQQENVRVELDGRALPPEALTVRTSAVALADVPAAGTLTVEDRPDLLRECRFLVLIVGTPVDEHLNPNFTAIHRAVEGCNGALRDGQILILRSTIFPGISRHLQQQLRHARADRVATGGA